jgi:SH3-like domain-containing protein
MTALLLRSAIVALALCSASSALAQSSLGGAGSLPPPQRPGGGTAPATQPPAAPTRPQATPAPSRPQATPAPRSAPRPAASAPARAPTPQAAPVVRPPNRPDARPRGGTTGQAARPPAQGRGRTAAGAAGAAAGAAGAAPARPAEPAPPPAAPAPDPQPSVGSVTNLPLPRFAALRSDNVNMRTGPGTRFPIEWTYQRRELPVEITREFELWRRIRDSDGTEGWVHQSTLMGRRSAIVRGAPGSEVALRRRPEPDAAPVARLRPGVVVRLRQCEARNPWCEAQVGDHRGYLRRAEVWGVTAEEEVK